MKKINTLFLILISFNTYSLELAIIHTNDLHSSFTGSRHLKSGHYARLSTAIKIEKDKADALLLVDSGDFYSGSILHSLAVRPELPYFPEYEFFDYLKYDAITLGNHEFDAGLLGFEVMLNKVKRVGSTVPIVSTNILYPSKILQKSLIKEIKNSNGETIKIGILGILGPDGCVVSRGNRKGVPFVGFDDPSATVLWNELLSLLKIASKRLKDNGVDIVLLLLHGGEVEDDNIAKEVGDIDFIIAGHTHKKYFKKVNNSFIAQAGSNGNYVGKFLVEFNYPLRKVVKVSHSFLKVGKEIIKDQEVDNKIKFYERVVNHFLKKHYPAFSSFPKVIFRADRSLTRSNKLFNKLGVEITSGIETSMKKKNKDFSVYLTSMSLIRNNISKDLDYTLKDIFKLLPIGFNNKLLPGASTVSFYVTFGEFKKLIQFLEIYSKFKPKFTPAFSSSLTFKVNRFGIPFMNRIKDIKIEGIKNIKAKTRIHIGTNSFIYKYLDFIKKKSFGLVEIIPTDKSGNRIEKPYSYGPEFLEYAASKL